MAVDPNDMTQNNPDPPKPLGQFEAHVMAYHPAELAPVLNVHVMPSGEV